MRLSLTQSCKHSSGLLYAVRRLPNSSFQSQHELRTATMWGNIQSFAYSLYLFTKSDIKTILIPIVRFSFVELARVNSVA